MRQLESKRADNRTLIMGPSQHLQAELPNLERQGRERLQKTAKVEAELRQLLGYNNASKAGEELIKMAKKEWNTKTGEEQNKIGLKIAELQLLLNPQPVDLKDMLPKGALNRQGPVMKRELSPDEKQAEQEAHKAFSEGEKIIISNLRNFLLDIKYKSKEYLEACDFDDEDLSKMLREMPDFLKKIGQQDKFNFWLQVTGTLAHFRKNKNDFGDN